MRETWGRMSEADSWSGSVSSCEIKGMSKRGSSPSLNIFSIVVPTIIGALLLLLAIHVYLVKRTRRKPVESGITGNQFIFQGCLEVELPNREEIAVNWLSSNFGRQCSQQFNDVSGFTDKLQHQNLVRLLGYCLEGEEDILIYEYVLSGSLNKYLFDLLKRALFGLEKHYIIIRWVAQGLLYLHEDSQLRTIHGDLKATNILLDRAMNARIADFGTAKLFSVQSNTREHK